MATWERTLKRIGAISLIMGSLGFYANGRLRLTSTYAVVAGPAIVIRSPGDGVASHSTRNFSIVEAGSQIASIKPVLANDPELRAVNTELETVRAEVASLKKLVSLDAEMRASVERRQSALGTRRAEHLRRLVEQADSELSAKRAAMEGAELARKRATELCAAGLMGTQSCEDVQTAAAIEKSTFASAEGQAKISRFLLASARSGADVAQDLGGEVTYARQQRDTLTLRLASLKQQLETQTARAAALELRANPPPIAISVSSKSRVWSTRHQSGTLASKGDDLFELIDCDQLFVFVTVSGARYEKLRIGMTAEIKIDDHLYHGTVSQLLGPYGTFSQDRGMQPQPPVIVNGRDAESAAVAVAFPELRSLLGPACEIGTRAEVEFTK